ncbi:MAG: P63C domain-containing protein [Actinobacteria bacterium]|nr:P63C domain-containing protein [Actinomycetota bacterium]
MEKKEDSDIQIELGQVSSSIPSRGGVARAKKLSPEQRKEIARHAVNTRWARIKALNNVDAAETLPTAKYKGVLRLLDREIPCYVLDDEQRVIGRIAVTKMLTGIKRQGDLESYIRAHNLQPFINAMNISERMVSFRLPEVDQLRIEVKGLPHDVLLDVCRGFMKALEASERPDSNIKLTSRQREIAMQAGLFLAACSDIGLMALIDEATGYQYERAQDALEVKLKAYLAEEMREWEKTFPDELWLEFGRLTGWSKSVTQRPKYWGQLVMELVYEYLDPDVAQWLKENAPKPRHGQNYHQWLSSQYGLKKLIEHIWKLIGIAKTCENIVELKERMAQIHGKIPLQYRFYLPPISSH